MFFMPFQKGNQNYSKLNTVWNKGKRGIQIGYWKGKTFSEEIRKKMSEAKKGKKGHEAWNKGLPQEQQPSFGKKHSKETKRKMSENRKGKGLNNRARLGMRPSNWKGGYENTLMLLRKRRIMKLGNGGAHTLGDWETLKAQYNWTCPSCKKQEPKIKLTEDHIIPISKGGSDNIENIQPLCKSCNSRKKVKIIKY